MSDCMESFFKIYETPTAYCLWSIAFVISSIDSIIDGHVELFDLNLYLLSESNLCFSVNLSNLLSNSFSSIWRIVEVVIQQQNFCDCFIFTFIYNIY